MLKITSLEMVGQILRRYASLDVPKLSHEAFAHHLLERRDSWFVVAGDVGLIYLTDLIPHVSAQLHVVFWDKKLGANRREVVKSVLTTAFQLFDLIRVNAVVAASNLHMRTMFKKVGFTLEGKIRRGWADPPDDAELFGMLREEVPWHVISLPSSSLD